MVKAMRTFQFYSRITLIFLPVYVLAVWLVHYKWTPPPRIVYESGSMNISIITINRSLHVHREILNLTLHADNVSVIETSWKPEKQPLVPGMSARPPLTPGHSRVQPRHSTKTSARPPPAPSLSPLTPGDSRVQARHSTKFNRTLAMARLRLRRRGPRVYIFGNNMERYHNVSWTQCQEENKALWIQRSSNRTDGWGPAPCSCFPSTTPVDKISVDLDRLLNLTWEDVDSGLTNLDPGGHWRPSHCAPLRRVAVIIPYRDRASHLRAFLSHTHPILQKQAVEYQIFVVEQNLPFVFNKGSLMNAGYKEVVENSGFHPDCLVYHDVDMLLESERNLFMCHEAPVHFAVYVNKFNYTLPYDALFGGGVALKPEQFKKINGYSNKFAGWGGEDDDFYRRVAHIYKKIYRPPINMSIYTMIKHDRDAGNPINKHAPRGFKSKVRSFTEGLSTLKYERISIDLLPTHTRILVNLPDTVKIDTQYDTLLSSRCLDPVYRDVAVSRPTCQYLCNQDDQCRVFQYEAPSGTEARCLMFQQPCSDIAADPSIDIHTRHDFQHQDMLML